MDFNEQNASNARLPQIHGITKENKMNDRLIHYKHYTMEIEWIREPDNMYCFHTILANGKEILSNKVHLNIRDDSTMLFRLFVDAGLPDKQVGQVGNWNQGELVAYIMERNIESQATHDWLEIEQGLSHKQV